MNYGRVLMVTALTFGLLVLSTCSDSDTVTGPVGDPTLVTDLAAGSSNFNSMVLTWTAPSGALEYDIRYRTDSLNGTNWDSATQVPSVPFPQAPGKTEIFRIEGLLENTDYFFGIRSRLDSANWAGLSNVVTGYTAPFDSRNKIAFQSSMYGNADIFIINADGTGLKRLTSHLASDGSPGWTPDGNSIVFETYQFNQQLQIGLMNIRTGATTNISNNAELDGEPDCSPNGQEVALSMFGHPSDHRNIVTMRLDGTNRRQLTNYSVHEHPYYPKWSPDGFDILYPCSFSRGNYGIVVMTSGGTNPVRLTDSAMYAMCGDWSPDGSKIVFHASPAGQSDIYIMNADGSNVVRITSDPASDDNPSWSPDGTRIAFTSDRDGEDEIFVMNIDGSNQTQITFNSAYESHPRWSPTY